MSQMMPIPHAILLLGPTGSGKTPLGEMLQARGLADGRPCAHFDFGGRLRRIAAGLLKIDDLADADLEFIGDVLDQGALLEDEHFHIAEKILRAFIAEQWQGRDPPRRTIILNGLPRHVGQAGNVDRIVEVRAVVELSCTPETVLARLAANTGGDRTGRIDDDSARVLKKLKLYTSRTQPLLDHYRSLGAAGICLTVGPNTTAEDAWRELNEKVIGSREPEKLQQPSPGQSEATPWVVSPHIQKP